MHVTVDELKDLTSPFDTKGRAFLAKAQRLLLNITHPRIASRAFRCGYREEEHHLGWNLYRRAAGEQRPFSHFLSQADQVMLARADGTRTIIKSLDDFENTWMPRPRLAIRRFVAEDRRAATEAAFYDNLEQQPEGPAVVGSVSLLLERLEGLRTSGVPGADKAYESLVHKGLTPDTLEAVKQDLAKVRAVVQPASPTISEAEQNTAAAEQLKAFEELKLWYADWAETLRAELPYLDLVRLGLRANKGGRGSADTDLPESEDVLA